MYGIFTDIGVILGLNVGKYTIHGAYGDSISLGAHHTKCHQRRAKTLFAMLTFPVVDGLQAGRDVLGTVLRPQRPEKTHGMIPICEQM